MGSKRRRKKEARRSRRLPEDDHRIVSYQLSEQWVSPWTGSHHAVGAPVVLLDVFRLDDGREIRIPAPKVWAFLLEHARDRIKRGESRRVAALNSLRPDAEDRNAWDVSNHNAVLDALGCLTEATLLSYAAIEAGANQALSQLDPELTVTVKRRGEMVDVVKLDMQTNLKLSEKLDLAVPIATSTSSIKGTKAWEAFRAIQSLRVGLVHIRAHSASGDPDKPGPYGRLMRGDASKVVEGAELVLRASGISREATAEQVVDLR